MARQSLNWKQWLVGLRNNQVKLFAVAFFGFGLLFVFITPPIANVDESSHFYRSYQVSNFNFVPDNIGQESGGNLPIGLAQLVQNDIHADQTHTFWAMTKNDFHIDIGKTKMPLTFTNTTSYPSVDYAPQAAGIFVTHLVTSKVLLQFYAGRLCNLIFLGISLIFAIRWLPYGKTALMIVGLLPETIYLGASYSADSFVIASSALFMAYILRLLQVETIRPKQYLALACLSSMLALSKQGYIALLIPAVILVFRSKRPQLQNLLKLGAALALPVILLGTWLLILGGVNHQPIQLEHSVGVVTQPAAQTHFILSHPLEFIKIVLVTFENQGVFAGLFGILGSGNIGLPFWAIDSLLILVVLSLGVKDTQVKRLNRIATSLYVTAALLTFLIIVVALYILWTPLRQDHVNGTQGRYFIPIFIALIPALVGRYRHTISWRKLYIASNFFLVVTVYILINHYYA